MPRQKSDAAPKVLHCHSAFGTRGIAGQAALQSVQLMNGFGARLRHWVVSAQPDVTDAKAAVDGGVVVTYLSDFPSLTGWPSPGRLLALAKAMQGYDLILTYGWGAMDAVMAHTAFGQSMALSPLIHHENGFDPAEVNGPKRRRNWYRRIALGRATSLVVPSERLEAAALETWYQPIGRVKNIAAGIDTRSFSKTCKPDALRRVVKRDVEQWIGTLGGSTSHPALKRLLTCLDELPDNCHLVVLGDVPNSDDIRDIASDLEISHRVHLPGAPSDKTKVMGLFDIFAVASIDAQLPLSMVQAMAAGVAVAAYDVGDIAATVAPANAPFIVDPAQPALLGEALAELIAMGPQREAIGAENREMARQKFDEKAMIESYRRLYASALQREI